MDTVEFNIEASPVMHQHPFWGGVSKNTPGRTMLLTPEKSAGLMSRIQTFSDNIQQLIN